MLLTQHSNSDVTMTSGVLENRLPNILKNKKGTLQMVINPSIKAHSHN